jgi:phage/plasmid-like protein (TIGR03299 family)
MNYVETLLGKTFAGVLHTENADTVNTMLDRFGLNWTVSKQPLTLPSGAPANYSGIVRNDTQDCFTTCKDLYKPFQNSELAEMLVRMSEKTGFDIHSGGPLHGGRKVYIQLKSPNQLKGIGNNKTTVEGYLTGINTHDGTGNVKWGETNFTVCCLNTFHRAMRALKNSARHTTSLHAKVEQGIQDVLLVVEEEKLMFEQFERLSNVRVDKTHLQKIVQGITSVDILMHRDLAIDQFGGRAMNKADLLLNSIIREVNQKGQTMWGLFSGVTNYTTHRAPHPDRENGQAESIYVGTAARINNTAFEAVLEMSGIN